MTSTQSVTRGTVRLLHGLGFAAVCELPLANGRRADVVALNKAGEVTIVEIKSCLSDFRADHKWRQYLPFANRFYFAVDSNFPLNILEEDESLPEVTGVIIADAYDGEIVRAAAPQRVHPSRRKTLHLKMARVAAARLTNSMLQSQRAS